MENLKLKCVYRKDGIRRPTTTAVPRVYCDVNSIVFVFIIWLCCCSFFVVSNEDTRLILLHSNNVVLLLYARESRECIFETITDVTGDEISLACSQNSE